MVQGLSRLFNFSYTGEMEPDDFMYDIMSPAKHVTNNMPPLLYGRQRRTVLYLWSIA